MLRLSVATAAAKDSLKEPLVDWPIVRPPPPPPAQFGPAVVQKSILPIPFGTLVEAVLVNTVPVKMVEAMGSTGLVLNPKVDTLDAVTGAEEVLFSVYEKVQSLLPLSTL